MLIMIGFFQFFVGLAALVNDEFFVAGAEWTFKFDVSTWGWIHLLLGVVIALAGLGVFFGNVVARAVGVFVAALSALANFAWLPWYPIWSIIIIAVDVAIIWALTVHGRDLERVMHS
jgi:hypothetical protein